LEIFCFGFISTPFGTLWHPSTPFDTLRHPLAPFGTLRHPSTPFGTLRHPSTPFDTLRLRSGQGSGQEAKYTIVKEIHKLSNMKKVEKDQG